MLSPYTQRIKALENRAKTAFAKFTSECLTECPPPQTVRPGPRHKLAAALKTATENPGAKFEKASSALRADVEACAKEWQAIEADAHAWLDVARALRGDDAEVGHPALLAAVETLKTHQSAASLAREIEATVEPLLGTVASSADRHSKSMRNAARHAIHKHGIALYEGLGDTRRALTHDLLLKRAQREADARKASLNYARAGGTNGR